MKIECLICGNTWTKHQWETELVLTLRDQSPDASDGWCPVCGETGAAYEIGGEDWKAEKRYQDSVRSLARSEYVMAGKPNQSYREYDQEARRGTA